MIEDIRKRTRVILSEKEGIEIVEKIETDVMKSRDCWKALRKSKRNQYKPGELLFMQ